VTLGLSIGARPAAILREAQQLVERAASGTRAPIVLWSRLGEAPEHFEARLSAIRAYGSRLILAVVPAAYQIPEGVRGVELADKMFRLLHPSLKRRYKVAYGGRASAKSWSIARVLILAALIRPIRCACARELQNSLEESVHKLLSLTIEQLGLDAWFTIQRDRITSHCGGEFTFVGLRHNTSKVRSYEGATHCWVEEANAVSEDSWRVLIPTIRAPGSCFLISFNPDREDDPVYARFVKTGPPDTLTEFVGWRDNPWLSAEMDAERRYLESVDAGAASWVWGGNTRAISNAIVFSGKFAVEGFTPATDWNGPYLGLDLGFSSDPSVLTKSWIHDNKLYIEREAWGLHIDIDKLPALLDQIPNARKHTIRCDSARPETVSYLKQHGYPNVVSVEKWKDSVADGVSRMRAFAQIVLHPSCEHTAQEFRLYAYRTDRLTNDVLPDIVDKHNHCIDSIRYGLSPLIKSGGGRGLLNYYSRAGSAAGQRGEAVVAAQDAGALSATTSRLGGRATDLVPGVNPLAAGCTYIGSFKENSAIDGQIAALPADLKPTDRVP
jgi:phage terminase large subunit